MTVVNVGLRVPSAAGRKPAGGRLGWQATKRLVDGAVVVLPARTSVELVGETTTVDIEPGVYWFTEDTNGGESAYRIVPDVGPVDYAAMAAVDPATLEPEAVPEAAWYAYTDTLAATAQTSATAATQARDAAVTSQTSAQNSATAAGNSATSAADSATTATTAATDAGNSRTAAGLSATAAAQSELAASGHATNAGNSATSAAGSAAGAESARAGMITTGTVDETGHLILGRVDANEQDAGYVVGPPIQLSITETTTGPDTPGTPGPQGLTGPKGDPGGWTASISIPADVNLDTYTTPGLYYQGIASQGRASLNYPADGVSGQLNVYQQTVFRVQQFTPLNSGRLGRVTYQRILNGTWTPWAAMLSQRVDTTAGRAIYAWDDVNNRDQLVYGDTGWRTLTLLNGWTGTFQIRRMGYTVKARVLALDGTAATAQKIIDWPAGFAPDVATLVLFANSVSEMARRVYVDAANGFALPVAAVYASSGYAQITDLVTSNTWPTTLPGTASGTIPNL